MSIEKERDYRNWLAGILKDKVSKQQLNKILFEVAVQLQGIRRELSEISKR